MDGCTSTSAGDEVGAVTRTHTQLQLVLCPRSKNTCFTTGLCINGGGYFGDESPAFAEGVDMSVFSLSSFGGFDTDGYIGPKMGHMLFILLEFPLAITSGNFLV